MSLGLLVAGASLFGAAALDNGLALTPAMGYNTWNDFRCSGINAANVMKVADAIVGTGLSKLGYEYVNIDDCWATSRDASSGRLVPDPTAFPNGMKAVADYVHSKGLKFGIYTDRGTKTCAGRPASQDHEDIDAQTFADWGVDYVKEDSCNAPSDHDTAFAQYGKMRDALNKTGRHIYFSLCGWNNWYAPPGYSLGNSWRIAGDCNGWDSIVNAIRTNEPLGKYAKPGGWNDPDMLVGSTKGSAVYNTPDQARTQFSLWSIMAAPLLIGSNILGLSQWDLETYSNTEVIAIDQDKLGQQGQVIWSNCPFFEPQEQVDRVASRFGQARFQATPACQQIWGRPLFNGDLALGFVNYNTTAVEVTCDSQCFSKLNITGSVKVRDLWQHKDLGTFQNSFSSQVGANGASVTLRFSKA